MHIDLPMTVKNVLSIELASIEMPSLLRIFKRTKRFFEISDSTYEASDGNYFHDFNSTNDLSNNIGKQINNSITGKNLNFYINNVNGHSVFKNSSGAGATTIHLQDNT